MSGLTVFTQSLTDCQMSHYATYWQPDEQVSQKGVVANPLCRKQHTPKDDWTEK
jgi:hypothetical protein